MISFCKSLIVSLLLLPLFVSLVNAEYVLPYPSYMPGNKLYKVSELIDKVQEYWHWGSVAKEQYYLQLSDKKLVEAKVLFEYKQYQLAVYALQKSDDAFKKIPAQIELAFKNGEDINSLVSTFREASVKHKEILQIIQNTSPAVFAWAPEKTEASTLHLEQLLSQSMQIREENSQSSQAFNLCTKSISSTRDSEKLYNTCDKGKESFIKLLQLETN